MGHPEAIGEAGHPLSGGRTGIEEKGPSASQMHRTYLAGIERALRNPSLENLVKLANALDITVAELFSTTPHGEAQQRRDP